MSDEPAIVAPEAVDAAWLEAVLRHAGVLGAGRVASFTAGDVGTGQVGRNVRFALRLEGAPAGAPASLVAKFPSDDPTSRATGQLQGNYEREVRFYRELVHTVGIRTPRCLFAAFDPASHAFVIAMEDVAPARQGDQVAGCSVDEAALALEELARLHAPRWNDPALDRVDWLQRRSPESAAVVQALYGSVLPGFRERYGDRLDPESLALVERFAPKVSGWILAGTGPSAVTHGDYRLDNMLFGGPGEPGGPGGAGREAPPPLAVVDWQTPGHGHPVGDACYFLGAGLPVDARRAHERELLAHYHARLVAGGASGYDLEACRADYRRLAFGGVVMAVVASMIVGRSERGDAMFLAMARRHCAHALDLEAERLLD